MTSTPSSRPRILVVDDDDAMGRLIHRVLSAHHDVTVEGGARAALRRIEAGERFDLILCDVTMPGMSGVALHTHLRQASPEAADRMVLMTGGGLEPEEETILSSLAAPRLDKPFSPSELRARVDELLSRRVDAKRPEPAAPEQAVPSDVLARIGAAIPGALYSFELAKDGTSRVIFSTPALEDLFGVSRAAMAKDVSAWVANLPPEEATRVNAGIMAAAVGPTPWHDLYRYRHPTKGLRWIEGWSTPVKEPDGRIVWHGLLMDVTDRRLAEERVERLSRLYRTRSDTNEAIVRAASEAELFQRVCDVVLGLGGLRVVRISTVDRERNALVETAIAGEPRPAIWHELPLDPAQPKGKALGCEAVRQGRALVENDVPGRVPPEIVPAETRIGSAICLPLRRGGEVVGVLGLAAEEKDYFDAEVVALLEAMGEDVSFCLEHLARARELRDSEERHRILIENLEDVVYATDEAGRLTFVSGAIERFGYAPRELLGQPLFVLVHPEDTPAMAAKREELMAGRHVSCELRLVDAKGATRFVHVSARPIWKDGRVAGSQGVFTDLTRQRETEEQLRLSQKMEAIGRLAGGVAHDFNNLLAVISSYTDLAMEALPEGSAVLADLSEVRSASERASGLTKQLLAFSRKQVLNPQVLDLNALVRGVWRMLERLLGEDIELVFLPAPELGATRADAGQIEQVLMNLAVNARHAMPDGGTLVIATSNVDLSGEEASRHACIRPGAYVKIAVSDTGAGMDAATKARVFDPFFTTKPAGQGTGLGLATVYGIVKQSGGCVTVSSEPGAGTTFEVFLPREAAAHVPAPAPEPAPAPAAREKRATGTETILVVEDEAAVRNVTRRLLEAAGYTVLTAASGAEALAICAGHAAEIRLLLTDVVMPGMNGRELADRLGALRPGIRVLFMSGYTDDAIVHRGVLQPGTRFLEKPFVANALLHEVRSALDEA